MADSTRRTGAAGLLSLVLAAMALAIPALAPPATAAELETATPYTARYAAYRNGKLSGKIEVVLERGPGDARWRARSDGSGTHGLARLLGARDREETRGVLQDGRFRPERYRRHTQTVGFDDRWDIEFDWAEQVLRIAQDRDEPRLLPMVGEPLDPLTLKLEIRRLLAEGAERFEFQMVKEDEIDTQRLRTLPDEWLETSLGCLRTRPVEKIRENSTRYTRAWHAPELGWIEVRMEHGKTGSSHMEMRISELTVAGEAVAPRPGCAALQQGERP